MSLMKKEKKAWKKMRKIEKKNVKGIKKKIIDWNQFKNLDEWIKKEKKEA